MLPGILGTKVGMTHVFAEDGSFQPVTVIQAGPVFVTQIKTVEKDKYSAIQVGFGKKSDKNMTWPKFGHLKKAGVNSNLRWLREFRGSDTGAFQLGQEIRADVLKAGDDVTVIGVTKGRGFAGGVKRYGFKGQHMTHGYMTHRRPLSNGPTGPAKVHKGKRGPGRMGGVQVSQLGSKIVKVDAERDLVLVTGSVPGPNGALVTINKEGK